MRYIFILSVLFSFVGCRGGELERRHLAVDPSTMVVSVLQSSTNICPSATAAIRCVELGIEFLLEDVNQRKLPDQTIRWSVNFPYLLSQSQGQTRSDGEGRFRIDLRFAVNPLWDSSEIVFAFQMESERFGKSQYVVRADLESNDPARLTKITSKDQFEPPAPKQNGNLVATRAEAITISVTRLSLDRWQMHSSLTLRLEWKGPKRRSPYAEKIVQLAYEWRNETRHLEARTDQDGNITTTLNLDVSPLQLGESLPLWLTIESAGQRTFVLLWMKLRSADELSSTQFQNFSSKTKAPSRFFEYKESNLHLEFEDIKWVPSTASQWYLLPNLQLEQDDQISLEFNILLRSDEGASFRLDVPLPLELKAVLFNRDERESPLPSRRPVEVTWLPGGRLRLLLDGPWLHRLFQEGKLGAYVLISFPESLSLKRSLVEIDNIRGWVDQKQWDEISPPFRARLIGEESEPNIEDRSLPAGKPLTASGQLKKYLNSLALGRLTDAEAKRLALRARIQDAVQVKTPLKIYRAVVAKQRTPIHVSKYATTTRPLLAYDPAGQYFDFRNWIITRYRADNLMLDASVYLVIVASEGSQWVFTADATEPVALSLEWTFFRREDGEEFFQVIGPVSIQNEYELRMADLMQSHEGYRVELLRD